MDRETKRAYEIIQKTIVENLDRLQAARKKGIELPSADVNDLRKWRRFGAAFAWDPLVFKDILEKPDMEPAALISRLRSTEDGLMRQFQYVKGAPIHHEIANRTGGDLGIRTPIDIWEDTKKRIFDLTGATPGNNQANLNALNMFDELWHQGRLGAKGSVFAEVGLIRPKDFPYLHRAGQKLAEKFGLDPKLVQASAEEQAQALLPSIEGQQYRMRETTATPQVQAQRGVYVRAGLGEVVDRTTPGSVIQLIERFTRHTPLPRLFAQSGSLQFDATAGLEEFKRSPEFKLLQDQINEGLTKQGSPPLKGTQMFGMLPIPNPMDALDVVRKNAVGAVTGALSFVEPEAIKSAFQGDYEQAAIQTAQGATAGAIVEGVSRLAGPTVTRVAASVLPKSLLSIGAGAAKFAPPLLAGYLGHQVLNAIVEGSTGHNLQETGVLAEQKKQKLREQGYSEHELRRRARTGWTKP